MQSHFRLSECLRIAIHCCQKLGVPCARNGIAGVHFDCTLELTFCCLKVPVIHCDPAERCMRLGKSRIQLQGFVRPLSRYFLTRSTTSAADRTAMCVHDSERAIGSRK